MEAKQAADTEPTYPNPKMLTDKPNRNSPFTNECEAAVPQSELYQSPGNNWQTSPSADLLTT
jgi:hypothetical protein